MQKYKKEILSKFRNKKLYNEDLKNYIEERISDNLGFCCRENKSINEWKPDESFIDKKTNKGKNQKTVFITARLFDLWEEGLIEILNKEVRNINENLYVQPSYSTTHDLQVINKKDSKVIDTYRWEVKTTLSEGHGFTSVTHGKGKCDNYILIKYNIDKNYKLSQLDNKGFLTEMLVIVWDGMTQEWKGEPSNKSSFTTLQISVEEYIKRKEILVLGSIRYKKQNGYLLKWCKLTTHKFQ